MIITKPQPINLILSITIITCLLAHSISEKSIITWIPIIIILTVVGGLIVIYTLIICLSPNEPSKEKPKYHQIIILTILVIIPIINQKEENKINESTIYSSSWISISTLRIILILCISLISKLSFCPNKTIKSIQ